jgi:integrase
VSIRKIGQRWQVRLRLGRGQRVERTLPRGATRADARALEDQIRRAHIDALAGRRPDRLIDEALDRWTNEEVRHQKSARRTLQRVNVLRDFTAGKSLSDLPTVASKLKASTAAPATINRYLSALRRIGNLCESWGWLERAPKIQLLEERNERHVYLAAADVERLARHCQSAVAGDLVRLAALTGLRRGELLGLERGQLRGRSIVLDARTKSGRPRVVPLSDEALRIARRRLPWSINADELRREFERARKAVGMEHVHFHDLRHTYASWLVQSGVNMKAVKELLGHSTMAMTDRYAHLASEHLTAAIVGLPRIGKGKR